MSAASAGLRGSSWKARHLRATKLLTGQPHARELLQFYLELLQLQEPLYEQASASDWRDAVRARPEEAFPLLRLERLPLTALLPPFGAYLEGVTPVATELLAGIAQALHGGGRATQADVLEAFLERRGLEPFATPLGCDAVQLEFFPRSFMQPIAEALAEQHAREAGEWHGSSCPQCARLPIASVIRDEAEIKGRRLLVCSLCATAWPFPRSTCPNCGETDAERLIYHVGETMSHVRVEECATCRVYLKSVDLRERGTAVPLVEDIASVELDLWSDEQGLRKLQPNVLGL